MWGKRTTRELTRNLGQHSLLMLLLLPAAVMAQESSAQSAAKDDSDARPPVTAADLQIVKRARARPAGKPLAFIAHSKRPPSKLAVRLSTAVRRCRKRALS